MSGSVSCPVVRQQAIYVLIRPRPVVAIEHPANRFDHPLCVARVQVEVADQMTVLVGDGDCRLDRPRGDSLRLQAQAVQGESRSGMLAWCAGRNA